MTKSSRIHYFEIILYASISIILLVIPLFMRFEDGMEWSFIFREWKQLLPFFVIFLINNFILAPKLLLKSKFAAYIVSCILLLLLLTFLNNTFLQPKFSQRNKQSRPETEFRENPRQEIHDVERERPPHHEFTEKHSPKDRPMPPHKMFFKFSVFIIGLLVIGFNSGIKILVRWMSDQDERNEKERQYLSTELAFLKQQVSPHFFMNTLNNIHALVDIDSEEAKDAIIKLSRLMRYLLYETEAEQVPLSKEIEFLESYVELMRLRYDEANLSINISYSDDIQSVKVPSLLFLPLLENAFKHGVQNNKDSFIDIHFKINDDTLILTIKNSKFAKKQTDFDEASGIGLENIRKRLNLIYKTNYILLINSEENTYEVSLAIPIESNNKKQDL